jgi:thiosulfate dehydrogenase [quinone] large subunit
MLLPASRPTGGIATLVPTSQPTGGPAASPSAAAPSAAGGATPNPPAPTPAPAGSPAAGNAIANVSDFASAAAVGFTVPSSGDPGGIIKLSDGTFVAYDLVCTHEGCTVSNYDSKAQLLECPCHGATFDAAQDARVVSGPAPRPLTKVPITVDPNTGAITVAS